MSGFVDGKLGKIPYKNIIKHSINHSRCIQSTYFKFQFQTKASNSLFKSRVHATPNGQIGLEENESNAHLPVDLQVMVDILLSSYAVSLCWNLCQKFTKIHFDSFFFRMKRKYLHIY